MWICGVRSFAGEVLGFARAAGLEVTALLDPGNPARETAHGLPVRSLEEVPPGSRVLVGTGDVHRRDVVNRLAAGGAEPLTLIHPAAHVPADVEVGVGALIAPGVIIGSYATIGPHTVLGRGSLVGHHTRVEELATLGPGANVGGNTVVEPEAFVAMGAVVRDHVTIGARATVAMGAVVVSDVLPGAEVRGLPAR